MFTANNSRTNRIPIFLRWLTGHIRNCAALDPNKPVMIAEWATGEFPFEADAGGNAQAGMDQTGSGTFSNALSAG